MVLELVVHAGGVEGLFSDMTGTKTKNGNQINTNILRMISQTGMGLYFVQSSLKRNMLVAA